MSKKLYRVKTQAGHTMIQDATLDHLQNKFEFSLNDLVEAEIMKVGEELSRKIKIKTNSDIYNMLAKEIERYWFTVERTI